MSRRRGYPIIGGPLDGKLAREADFYATVVARHAYASYRPGDVIRPGGQYGDYGREYLPYNRASSGPTSVWLHTSLLP